MEGYLTIKEVAKKWNISQRRVQVLCSSGRIEGAIKSGRGWRIPVCAEKPSDERVTTGQYRDWRRKDMEAKMFRIKEEILKAIVQYGVEMNNEMPKLIPMINEGVMSIPEFIEEVIMELIRYGFDLYQEKNSIRGHLMDKGMFDDSQKAAYGRALKYAQKYRDLEADRRLSEGDPIPEDKVAELRGLKMNNIEQKKSGHKLTSMQFFELTQLKDIRILKSFVEHRLENTHKVSHGAFREMFSEYDDFLKGLIPKEDMSSEEYVFNTLAFWVLEWKYPLLFFYDVAVFMEEKNIDNIEAIKLCRLCGDCRMFYKYGTIATHSRFIKNRSQMIPKVLCAEGKETDEIDFDTFTLEQYLQIKALMMQNYMIDADKGLLLKDWFYRNTTVDDWAYFLKQYDLFSILKEKEWTDSRVNTVKKLINEMTIKY